MIYENIKTLYELFANIEKNFNELVENVNGNNCIKYRTLNAVGQLEDNVTLWITDNRFTTGTYKKEETHE